VAGAAVVGKVGWKRITSPFRKNETGAAEEPAVDERVGDEQH
jgi:hypothetical protein